MGKKYKNPPLVEALCEFQFIPAQPWDITIPGLIYKEIKEEFPDKQEQMGLRFQFRQIEKGVEHKTEQISSKIQFFRKDKTALVQIAPDLLAINCLKPYPSWEKFKPLIINNLEIYRNIANPKGLRRVELRYINVIEFKKSQIELTDYFHYYPFIPNKLPQLQNSFLIRVEFPYKEGQEILILTLGTVIPSKPNVLSILLDIDYVMATPEYVSIQNISEWLERAHQEVENAFEVCITDKAREIFEEE